MKYRANVEFFCGDGREAIFHIEAYDWNCPQHITPRYTEEEIEEALTPQREYIKKLEEEIKALKLK